MEAQGVRGDLSIPFLCPLLVKGGSKLPEGQTTEDMFAQRLVSGQWRVQKGVAGLGEGERSLTSATVIPLATVVGWDQRRAEWANMAWLAMHVHVGKARRGGGWRWVCRSCTWYGMGWSMAQTHPPHYGTTVRLWGYKTGTGFPPGKS